MNYKPINFIILRTAGIPIKLIDEFNFSNTLINEIINKPKFDKFISEKIQNEMNIFKNKIKDLLSDHRLRDMMRLSTFNYKIFMKKILNSNSLLSQYQRKLLLYLQRGTLKCCTAGSYGPIANGEFEHSCKNLQIFKENEERSIIIEDWALNLILNSSGIKIKQEEYYKIMENYQLLNKFNNRKLDLLVQFFDKYKKNVKSNKRDVIFEEILKLFEDITGVNKKTIEPNQKRKKDYESRSIFYELGKRNLSFQIGQDLKKDFDLINKIIGIYLTLLTKKFLDNIKNNTKINNDEEITKYIFDNFHDFSEFVVEQIINNKITDFSRIDYPYEIMPPIFSPDITISSKNIESINKGEYKLVVGEIHISATIISNPMYEFKREKLIDNFISALKQITNDKIDFQGYKIQKNKDFTHYLPLIIQKDIINEFNKTANNNKKIYAYRSDKYLANKDQLYQLLFFPLSIGRKLIFNYHKEEKWDMWAKDYIPNILKRISRALYPKLDKKIIIRKEQKIKLPKIHLPRSITETFIFDMMKCIKEWQKINNVDEEIFVRYNPERKPIYVNLKNPFLVYEFIKLSSVAETISISKFYPDKNQQWLSDKEGNYASEIRYMVCPCIDEQKLENPKNKVIAIFLPGYKSRLDELYFIKKELFNSGVDIKSLIIDYNQNFEELSKKISNQIKNEKKI